MDATLRSLFHDLAGLDFPALPEAPCPPPWGDITGAAARMAHHVVTGRVLPEYTAELADLARVRDTLGFFHDYAAVCLRLREAGRQAMRRHPGTALCSLGLDCLPRTLLTKYGLIPARAEGRASGPFDLSTHGLEAVAKLLENGFARFAEPGRLRHLGRPPLPWERGHRRMILHRDYDARFNHDVPYFPTRTSLRQLSSVLAGRVRNLDALVSGARRALFVLDSPDPVEAGMAERILAALRARYRVPATLLALAPGEAESFHLADGLCRATYVAPFAGFRWHFEHHYMTPGGVAFESCVVGHVLRCVEEMEALEGGTP